MGTQREEGVAGQGNGVQDEEEDFHWLEVKPNRRQELVIKLNPRHFRGNDWTMLADHLGYGTAHIEVSTNICFYTKQLPGTILTSSSLGSELIL